MAKYKEVARIKVDQRYNTEMRNEEMQANDIESIACIATDYFYDDQPEIALSYYRLVV